MIILTHRGLEPNGEKFFPESSYEAFKNHIERGFGLEFDPNFTKDGIIVFHDASLKRITDNKDVRLFSEVNTGEILKFKYGDKIDGRIPKFSEVLELIEKSNVELHALHLKGINQTKEKVDRLITEILEFPSVINKLLIFDVKSEIAEYIKSKIPEIKLAPSVAHEYDIKRYGSLIGNTLLSINQSKEYKKLYDWVWLDEWDTLKEDGSDKKFYTKENFDILRKEGYNIALVTPELHGTSPGLLGGESHSDAGNKEKLFERIKEIIALKPDAICTDYPFEVLELVNN
ncbi:MAG TPA: glycerophosphodiester phosphodiesterase family protein [Candidatus Nanoarchaeia archaeon]|nr:glycerophosphodiester phosphodiesterase family protein [Candidatus Nanoarchaeia archaeon]